MAVTNADLMRQLAANHEAVEQRLDRLEAKVDRTNGRVTTLELWRARADGFRAAFAWGPAALAATVGGVGAGIILVWVSSS